MIWPWVGVYVVNALCAYMIVTFWTDVVSLGGPLPRWLRLIVAAVLLIPGGGFAAALLAVVAICLALAIAAVLGLLVLVGTILGFRTS
jgi:hypothetical protein